MVKIVFVDHEGREFEVDGVVGTSVMQAAVEYGVPGIEAECGGACACATCHVYIDSDYEELVPVPGPVETAMLELVERREARSRLACQIDIIGGMAGIRIHTPESQY